MATVYLLHQHLSRAQDMRIEKKAGHELPARLPPVKVVLRIGSFSSLVIGPWGGPGTLINPQDVMVETHPSQAFKALWITHFGGGSSV
jgi:hypothetical protein